MYRTRVRSFFLVNRRNGKVRLKDLNVEMNGYRDDDAVKEVKDSLNSGREFKYRFNRPFYYLLNSLFKEYRGMIDKIKKERN